MAEIFDNMLYPVQIALSGHTFFALWYCSDTDGFLLRTPGKLRTFPERHTAEVFCRLYYICPAGKIQVPRSAARALRPFRSLARSSSRR